MTWQLENVDVYIGTKCNQYQIRKCIRTLRTGVRGVVLLIYILLVCRFKCTDRVSWAERNEWVDEPTRRPGCAIRWSAEYSETGYETFVLALHTRVYISICFLQGLISVLFRVLKIGYKDIYGFNFIEHRFSFRDFGFKYCFDLWKFGNILSIDYRRTCNSTNSTENRKYCCSYN